MRTFCLLFILLSSLAPLSARAELSPSAYEAMQAKAPEFVKLDVLRVDVEPGTQPDQQKVLIVAMVTDVMRTASNLKVNDLVNITYTVTERPKGWVGPGEVPVPAAKDQTVAYLSKTETNDYTPAAGRMTFSQF